MLRRWNFSVACATLPGEVVCLTGSCPQLGDWKVDQVIQLKLSPELDSTSSSSSKKQQTFGSENLWSTDVSIPDGIEVSFRYCVCIFVTPDRDDSNSKIVVRRWETNLVPRRISCHGICPEELEVSRFGHISDLYHVHGGWLTHETAVQLKLLGSKAVNIWKKKHSGKRLFIKVTPVETSQANLSASNSDLDESLDISETREKRNKWPIVEVAKLSEDDCAIRPQCQFGIEYEDEDFILFRAQMLDLPTVAFLVDIYGRPKTFKGDSNSDYSNEPADHIGSCYVMPNHFKSTEGKIQVTIVSNRLHPIGQFTTYYSVVHPMPNVECDFSVTYANHWKPHWKGLDVGHRGLGNSYTKRESCATVRENTIGSMKNAADHGADMVEFDVQLSHDLIPVVYHDFELLASIVNKAGDQQTMIQMPLKNLTLQQLQQLRTFHPSEKSAGPKTFQQETDDDHQPFPSLEHVLKTIDVHVGFNIELKWDMEHLDGSRSSHNAFEMNLFVDTVLKTVMDFAGLRKIVFSSFNPDVCYAIRLKQNFYPVLFLTQGVNSKYEDYLDPRTRTVGNATYFASMAEILGVNAIAEDLLRDHSLVHLVKEKFKLILFTWTDDRNDASTVKQLKALGIDGVIYDRMDWNNHKEVKESVFLLDAKPTPVTPNQCSCNPSSSVSPSEASASPAPSSPTTSGASPRSADSPISSPSLQASNSQTSEHQEINFSSGVVAN